MSLKAKLEAVIYASEEPVTLAQLIGLLGEEGQAELDALAANQLSLDTPAMDGDTALDQDDLNAEVLNTSEESATPEADLEPPQESVILSEDSQSHRESQPKNTDAAHITTTVGPLSAIGSAEPATSPDAKLLAAQQNQAQKLAARKLREHFRLLLDQLIADYANSDRGLEIKEVASGFRFATKPEYHDAVRGFVKSLKPPLKLSLPALETLAVVAYKQPVTAPEVSEIRGVESAGTLGSLLTRKLITTAGRKQVIGRPILYKTTKDFLLRFGLKDINELPSIEEFEKMAGELNETLLDESTETMGQEEIAMETENQPHMDAASISAHNREAETGSSSEDSAPLDELHAVPKPTHVLHDTPEDLEADDSTAPEGNKHEPAGTKHELASK